MTADHDNRKPNPTLYARERLPVRNYALEMLYTDKVSDTEFTVWMTYAVDLT